jgi:hypothetical protein
MARYTELPQGYLWGGFTDAQLSMIASHLAGGGSLCCANEAGSRAAITRSEDRDGLIEMFGHEALGCRWDNETDEHWSTRSGRYLHNFLNTV